MDDILTSLRKKKPVQGTKLLDLSQNPVNKFVAKQPQRQATVAVKTGTAPQVRKKNAEVAAKTIVLPDGTPVPRPKDDDDVGWAKIADLDAAAMERMAVASVKSGLHGDSQALNLSMNGGDPNAKPFGMAKGTETPSRIMPPMRGLTEMGNHIQDAMSSGGVNIGMTPTEKKVGGYGGGALGGLLASPFTIAGGIGQFFDPQSTPEMRAAGPLEAFGEIAGGKAIEAGLPVLLKALGGLKKAPVGPLENLDDVFAAAKAKNTPVEVDPVKAQYAKDSMAYDELVNRLTQEKKTAPPSRKIEIQDEIKAATEAFKSQRPQPLKKFKPKAEALPKEKQVSPVSAYIKTGPKAPVEPKVTAPIRESVSTGKPSFLTPEEVNQLHKIPDQGAGSEEAWLKHIKPFVKKYEGNQDAINEILDLAAERIAKNPLQGGTKPGDLEGALKQSIEQLGGTVPVKAPKTPVLTKTAPTVNKTPVSEPVSAPKVAPVGVAKPAEGGVVLRDVTTAHAKGSVTHKKAPTYKGLAVTQVRTGRTPEWSVSHIDSGMGITHFDSQEKAIAAMKRIADESGVDWTKPREGLNIKPEQVKLTREIQDAIDGKPSPKPEVATPSPVKEAGSRKTVAPDGWTVVTGNEPGKVAMGRDDLGKIIGRRSEEDGKKVFSSSWFEAVTQKQGKGTELLSEIIDREVGVGGTYRMMAPSYKMQGLIDRFVREGILERVPEYTKTPGGWNYAHDYIVKKPALAAMRDAGYIKAPSSSGFTKGRFPNATEQQLRAANMEDAPVFQRPRGNTTADVEARLSSADNFVTTIHETEGEPRVFSTVRDSLIQLSEQLRGLPKKDVDAWVKQHSGTLTSPDFLETVAKFRRESLKVPNAAIRQLEEQGILRPATPSTPPVKTEAPKVATGAELKAVQGEAAKIASGRAEFSQARATVGGEVGPNGEFYEGGKFIATTPETVKGAMRKVKTAGENANKRNATPLGTGRVDAMSYGAGGSTMPADKSLWYDGPIKHNPDLKVKDASGSFVPSAPNTEAIKKWNRLIELSKTPGSGVEIAPNSRGSGKITVDILKHPEYASAADIARYVAKGERIPAPLMNRAKEVLDGINIDRYHELLGNKPAGPSVGPPKVQEARFPTRKGGMPRPRFKGGSRGAMRMEPQDVADLFARMNKAGIKGKDAVLKAIKENVDSDLTGWGEAYDSWVTTAGKVAVRGVKPKSEEERAKIRVKALERRIKELKEGTVRTKPTPATNAEIERLLKERDELVAAKKSGPSTSAKIRAGIKSVRLANPANRVMDVASNTASTVAEQAASTFDSAFDRMLFPKARKVEGPASGVQWWGAKNALKGARKRWWAEFKKGMGETDPAILKKYNTVEAPGPLKYVQRATGTTDIPFRDYTYRAAKAELKRINPKLSEEAIEEIATEEAARSVFMGDTWFTKFWDGVEDGARKAGGEAGLTLLDSVAPFTRVISNIAGRTVDYTPAGLVKGTVKTVNGMVAKELDVATRREINRLFSRGLVGSGLMLAGAKLYDDGKIAPQELNKKFGYVDWGSYGGVFKPDQLGPAAAVTLLGAAIQAIKKSNLTPKQKASMITKTIMDVPMGTPAVSGAEKVGRFAADPITTGNKHIASTVIPSLLNTIAEMMDLDAKGQPVKRDSGKDQGMLAPYKKRIPVVRRSLPPQ